MIQNDDKSITEYQNGQKWTTKTASANRWPCTIAMAIFGPLSPYYGAILLYKNGTIYLANDLQREGLFFRPCYGDSPFHV